MPIETVDLSETYLHLRPDERAPALPGGEAFWGKLMQGGGGDPAVEAIAGGGWLVTRFVHDGDWPHWECHPRGDEVLTCLDGEVTFVLETEEGEQTVRLTPGRTLVVPAGAWHRGLGRGPATILAITAGAGTEHRPA
jgi:mannose-6-phosphate isomerase-like protein (cupin superfamily)